MQRVFEGKANVEAPVRNICLHTEHAQDAEPLRSFDNASVLAFPQTFAAFRQGVSVHTGEAYHAQYPERLTRPPADRVYRHRRETSPTTTSTSRYSPLIPRIRRRP